MKKQLNKFYKIQDGDTLEIISKKYNINPLKILIYNSISPLKLKKGVFLYIKN